MLWQVPAPEVSLPPDTELPSLPPMPDPNAAMNGGLFLLAAIGLLILVIVVAIFWSMRSRKKQELAGRQMMLQDLAAGTGAWEKAGQEDTHHPAPTAATAPADAPMRACPHCRADLPATETLCPACGRTSEPWWERDGAWFTKDAQGNVFRWDAGLGNWTPA